MTATGRYGALVATATAVLGAGLGLATVAGVLTPPVARGAAAGLAVALTNAILAFVALRLGEGGSMNRFYLVFFGGIGLRTLIVLGTVAVLLVRGQFDGHGLTFGLLVGWTVYTVIELVDLLGRQPARRPGRQQDRS